MNYESSLKKVVFFQKKLILNEKVNSILEIQLRKTSDRKYKIGKKYTKLEKIQNICLNIISLS